MPQLSSPLSTPDGMPVFNAAHLAKLGGVHVHFPSLAAMLTAVGQASDLGWSDGQPMSIAEEADSGAVRVYRSSLGHARTARIGVIRVVLASDTNIVRSNVGAPASGVGVNGDYCADPNSGLIYQKASGAWTQYGGAVVVAPVSSGNPVISGTAQVGQTLSATNGTWSNSPTSYAMQWKRAGANISGATSSTYSPVTGDIGSTITCTVTATNSAGSASATSSATSAVIAAAIAAPYALTAFAVPGYANLTKPYSMLTAAGGGSGTKTYALTGTAPAGLTFDTITGELSGTPTSAGTTAGLTVTVTDDTGSVTTAPFSITVGAAPTAISASADSTGTTDSAAIEAALAAGQSVALASGVIIKEPILLRGNQSVYLAGGNAALFLAAGSNCPMFKNASQGSFTRTNANISIVGDGTSKLDGNGTNQATPSGQPSHNGMWLVSVQNMVVRGVITAPKNQNVVMIGCKDMALRDTTFAAVGGTNTDGLDCGPGCENIHAEVIRGAVGDDVFSFFAKAAQTGGNFSSGTPWEVGADCKNFICKDVQVSSLAQNMIRLQADTTHKLTDAYFADIYNTQPSNPNVLLLLGNASYIDAVPTTGDQLTRIGVERAGGVGIFLDADIRGSNVYLKDMYASGPMSNGLRLLNQVENVTLDGLIHSATTTVTHGSLVTATPGSGKTIPSLVVKNVTLPNLTSILSSNGSGTVTLDNIRLGAGSSLFPNSGTWTGTMKDVTVLDVGVAAFSGVTVTSNTPVATDALTTSYTAARSVALTTTRRWHLNKLLAGLREDGLLTALDRLYLLCDEAGMTDALRNVLGGSSATVAGGTGGTFTADQGIALDGTAEHILPGGTWQSAGKFALNSALMGVWINGGNSGTGGVPMLGTDLGTDTVRLYGRNAGAASWRINGAADNPGPTMNTRLRHHSLSRANAATTRRFFNGLANNVRAEAASALPTGAACVGHHGTAYSTDRFSVVYSGSGLTERQAMRLHARLATYTAAIGAQA